jgi:2-polyprenyl-3-methyl-5-hydroxy-6-metoxy-1,4-benzoquinol methylase
VTTASEYTSSRDELLRVFQSKYCGESVLGWGPKQRLKHNYFTPDDYYEALVSRLLEHGDRWCDVGCGRDIFPTHPALAAICASRCEFVFGIDPDENIKENRFLHEGFQGLVEDCPTTHQFDLVTMRMVAEHIVHPERAIARIARLLKPGGRVVIYTPHKWAPMSIVASIVPFPLHNFFKRFLWATEARDTFPTQYKLNTRKDLGRYAAASGMRELHFARVDDCRITNAYRTLNLLELKAMDLLRRVGLPYPEACIIAVYGRPRET